MNLWNVEQALLTRIEDQVTGLQHVASVSDLAGYTEIGPLLPAVFVQPGRVDVPQGPSDGRVQRFSQEWLIVLLVAHQADIRTADYATTVSRAGTIQDQLMSALIGWQPAAGWQTFAWAGNPEPIFDESWAEFGSLWQTGGLWQGTG